MTIFREKNLLSGKRDPARQDPLSKIIKACVCLCACVVLLSSCTNGGAESVGDQPRGLAPYEDQPVTTRLIAEHTSIRAQDITRIGVYFEIDEGWHIYAQDPGDAGLATSISWIQPSDASIGALQWPEPQEFIEPGDLRTFGYTQTLLLSSVLHLAKDALPGTTLPITAKVRWIACKDICIPGSAEHNMTLSVITPLSEPLTSPQAPLFGQYE